MRTHSTILTVSIVARIFSLPLSKGNVQRDVTGVEIGLNRLILKSYITGNIYF
jgi:hypothetical protein